VKRKMVVIGFVGGTTVVDRAAQYLPDGSRYRFKPGIIMLTITLFVGGAY
jgi:hypothetical protein